MRKRLLTIGYQINSIQGFEDIDFSNYSLKFTSEPRWKTKITNIEKKITNNELHCILIVVNINLVKDAETLSIKRFKEFLSICKKTNCVVAIQDYLLEEEPKYFDFEENKKLTINEIQEKVNQAEDNYESYLQQYRNVLPKEYNDDDIINTIMEGNEMPQGHLLSLRETLDNYSRKFELLKETERLFPKAKKIIEILRNEFNEIITFQYLSQLLRIAKDELIEQLANEILNIYIPKHYNYKDEFDDFIQVFEKYLKNIEQLNISVEINETKTGINYKFISNDKIETISDLPNKFNRFTKFIDICENEPETAISILEAKNIASDKALEIIQRLSKKYKRLVLDIKQQQERLELAYKQEVQSELFELGHSETPFSLVQKSFSIKAIDNVFHPSDLELELINLIKKHGENGDNDNIKTELGILNDEELKPEERRRSAHKLKKRLSKIMSKGILYAERILIETLVTYINGKLE